MLDFPGTLPLQSLDALVKLVQTEALRFTEPESVFLIRVNDRGIGFTEADGGMWKLRARETVKAFLEARLKKEIEGGQVIAAL